jgi:predicted DNA-binding protein (MmcQ/YjbR family)
MVKCLKKMYEVLAVISGRRLLSNSLYVILILAACQTGIYDAYLLNLIPWFSVSTTTFLWI